MFLSSFLQCLLQLVEKVWHRVAEISQRSCLETLQTASRKCLEAAETIERCDFEAAMAARWLYKVLLVSLHNCAMSVMDDIHSFLHQEFRKPYKKELVKRWFMLILRKKTGKKAKKKARKKMMGRVNGKWQYHSG